MVKVRENRVPIMMSDEELKSIDDWRYEGRVATRSEAIRRLCKIAFLAAPPILTAYELADEVVGRAFDLHSALIDATSPTTDAGEPDQSLHAPDGLSAKALDLIELAETLRLTLSGTFMRISDVMEAATLSEGVAAAEKRSAEIAEYLAEIKQRYKETRES